MNANELQKDLQNYEHVDVDSTNFEQLEEELKAKLEEQIADLQGLEEEREKIGNPNTLGDTVANVIWEQFINQIGTVAGEEFIKENGGLKLDLRDSAHIQTTDNFTQGKIASHNQYIDYKERYDTWQSSFEHEDNGSIKIHPTRAHRMEPTITENARAPFDKARPSGSKERGTDMDHTISAAEIIRDPAANAHLSREEQVAFANSDANLNEMDASLNRSKGDLSMKEWLENPNSKGQKPDEIFDISEDYKEELLKKDEEAREEYSSQKEAGEKRSKEIGRKSQKAEAKRIGGKALRAALMGLLASLVKDIIRQLVKWFRSGERKLNTFIDAVKDAIHTFLSNMKQHILTAGNVLLTTIASAIIGPLVGTIKKAWIFLKQGYKSVKDAIAFFKDPANKNKPFSLKIMEVGKILIAGLTAGGAILLGEVIEKGLMAIPGFAFEIPILGSLASLLGMFFGALVSGLVGALALNVIDRLIAKKQKEINTIQQIDAGNKILATQDELTQVVVVNTKNTVIETGTNIANRHEAASQVAKDYLEQIKANSEAIDRPLPESVEAVDITDQATEEKSEDDRTLDDTFDILNNL